MLVGSTPGLQNLDTTYDFYETPKTLSTWLEINKKYFLQESGMERLVPRGLLLAGPPGVGKSMAASVIAHDWDLPLFRLDVGATMNRWLGETEGRVYRSLSLVDANSPCVLLVDEVEKLFSTTEDGGTTQRVLSQLLWWLQFRRSRVLVVMTTNNLKSIPQELYRPGRIDKVITLELLTAAQATKFSVRVLESVTGKPATTKQLDVIKDTFWISAEHYSHAQVTEMVYDMVKNNKWVG
jgi:SpoVK/Ycf46/Vps4 family AAA+-type ATPase